MALLEAAEGSSRRGSHLVEVADLRVGLLSDLVPLSAQSLGVPAGRTGDPCWWQGGLCCGWGPAVGVALLTETLRENGHCRGEAVVSRYTHVKVVEGCCRCEELRWWCKNIGE